MEPAVAKRIGMIQKLPSQTQQYNKPLYNLIIIFNLPVIGLFEIGKVQQFVVYDQLILEQCRVHDDKLVFLGGNQSLSFNVYLLKMNHSM